MSDMPERIWAWEQPGGLGSVRGWTDRQVRATEYIRKDITAPRWFRIDDPDKPPPKDKDILVWFDHDADPYQDPNDPCKLTDYAAWAEGGDFLDGSGFCIAKWFPQHWESVDEYGGGYWLPAWWFAKENGDYERACNPTQWQPLPEPPQ